MKVKNVPAISGNKMISLLRPVLGLEGVPGIVEIRMKAHLRDATRLELDMIAKPDFDKCQATEVGEPAGDLVTKHYMVTVTEIDNGNNN